MSISLFVTGIRDPDGKFKDMLELKEHCDRLGISYPTELRDYFGSSVGESSKVIIDEKLHVNFKYDLGILQEWSGDDSSGYEFDVSDIPDDLKKIRVYIG